MIRWPIVSGFLSDEELLREHRSSDETEERAAVSLAEIQRHQFRF